jgi:hypothetical protein
MDDLRTITEGLKEERMRALLKDKVRSSTGAWDFIDFSVEESKYTYKDLEFIYSLSEHTDILFSYLEWMVDNSTSVSERDRKKLDWCLKLIKEITGEYH